MEENIYELIYLYHLHDEEALKLLIGCYRPMVLSFCTRQPEGTERDDYLAFADSLLVDCLDGYRQDLGLSFSTYYRSCLKNRSVDRIRYSMGRRPGPGIRMVYLDDQMPDGRHQVCESIPDLRQDLERQVMIRMQLDQLLENQRRSGDQRSMEVLSLRARQYSLREISARTGMPLWKVRSILDTALAGIRKKIDR